MLDSWQDYISYGNGVAVSVVRASRTTRVVDLGGRDGKRSIASESNSVVDRPPLA